jgi:hypothetical protein
MYDCLSLKTGKEERKEEGRKKGGKGKENPRQRVGPFLQTLTMWK